MIKYTNKYIIETGIGLQDVDGLKNSQYFLCEKDKYIKEELTLEDLDKLISSYYENKENSIERSKEADLVSLRIGEIISEDSFSLSIGELLAIHKFLFEGIFEHAGEFRKYNIRKEEWVLDNESVIYADYRDLEITVAYDLDNERKFDYSKLSIDEAINHLAFFIANLWQAHIFEEGNTRTIACFLIKYLHTLGFELTNDTFSKNSWYFRNALVRANYTNITKGIYEDKSYLVKFLRNLLLGEKNILSNQDLHISSFRRIIKNSKESKIISLMHNNPNIKLEDIAIELGVSLRTLKTIISKMKSNGLIERVNGKKYGKWEVNN